MGWGISEIASVISASGSLPLGDWSGGWTNYSSGQSKLKDAIRRQKEYDQWSALNMPTYARQGMEDAGFNPLLAYSSAAPNTGQIPTGFPSGGSSAGGRFIDFTGLALQHKQQEATIEQTNAATGKIKSEIGVNAWKPVTLSRAEARGLGVNFLGRLGINLNTSDRDTFTLMFNPVTGELQNPFKDTGVVIDGISNAGDQAEAARVNNTIGRLFDRQEGQHSSVKPFKFSGIKYHDRRTFEEADRDFKRKYGNPVFH